MEERDNDPFVEEPGSGVDEEQEEGEDEVSESRGDDEEEEEDGNEFVKRSSSSSSTEHAELPVADDHDTDKDDQDHDQDEEASVANEFEEDEEEDNVDEDDDEGNEDETDGEERGVGSWKQWKRKKKKKREIWNDEGQEGQERDSVSRTSKVVRRMKGSFFREALEGEGMSFRWEEVRYAIKEPKPKQKFASWQLHRKLLQMVRRQKQERVILHGVSGCVSSGELLAIMGPSDTWSHMLNVRDTGAGKTTLMSILVQRIKGGKLTGNIFVNNEKRKLKRHEIAYVEQEDVFLGTATVRETLVYAAMLLLPRSRSVEEKMEIVEDVIEEMDLKGCADTRIGTANKRGISGGEAKRTAIAMELITNPSVIFLDEPTTGLDSSVALSLVKTLARLARNGRTIICTIHQPRYEIFCQFTKLLLLCEGKTAYYGPTSRVVSYFADLGYRCSRFDNPADFCLDLVRGVHRNADLAQAELDPEEDEKVDEEQVERILSAWETSEMRRKELSFLFKDNKDSRDESDEANGDRTSESDSSSGNEEAPKRVEKRAKTAPLWLQLWVLTVRMWRHNWRDPMLFWGTLSQFVLYAVMAGVTWWRLPDNIDTLRDRLGAIWFLLLTAGFGPSFVLVLVIPASAALLKRERDKGAYQTSSYFLSFTTVFLPQHIVLTFIYCGISYFMVNLRESADAFFVFTCTTMLIVDAMFYIAFLFSAVSPSVEAANLIFSIGLIFWITFSGYFVHPDEIPVYFLWAYYTSVFQYASSAVAKMEFATADYTCDVVNCDLANQNVTIDNSSVDASALPVLRCEASFCLKSSDDVYDYFGLPPLTYWENMLILLAMVVMFRVLTYVTLRWITPRVSATG